MSDVLSHRSLAVEMCGAEEWPSDAELYQPEEKRQILLLENAQCLSVQAYLHMAGLDFKVVERHNAEYMSPSGRVPFLKAGPWISAELDPIISFAYTKGISLTNHLDDIQKGDMVAFMSMVKTVLGNVELYLCWVDEVTYQTVTKERFGSVFPWPLNWILCRQRRSQIHSKLKAENWFPKSLKNVYEDLDNCCSSLSYRLGNNQYFFNDRPTELDALVYGHLFTIMTTRLPDNMAASIIRKYDNLVSLCLGIDKEYFGSPSKDSSDSNFETL